ncbi:MAG: glutamate-1-semialdehyde 2,1-aminomutase [Candidatus Heimdallarchaeota archaeon]
MTTNEELFEISKKHLPGGVNSPVRAMKPDYPFFTEKGSGAFLWDMEGKQYLDYCMAYGPLIFGHARKEIIEAVSAQLHNGTIYGTPTELELNFAKKVTSLVPNIDMIRCLSTGTEATMTALRLARGFTNRDKVVKYLGAFHGAHDAVLVKAGSGALTHAVPNSHGIPGGVTKNTLLCEFNAEEELVELFDQNPEEIACVVMEPVIGNAGCIPPSIGYLESVRRICTENDSLLFFDEVITGFRLALGGAQSYFGVDADIVTFGKVAGGGLPIGILGAKKEIMEHITPQGTVYNAGTFNGNPISITAGFTAIQLLETENPYASLENKTTKLCKGLQDIIPNVAVQHVGSMYCMYMSSDKIANATDATAKADSDRFLQYQRKMLKEQVFHPPSQYECNFLSTAHSDEDIEQTIEKAKECAL